jgi:hypothetical protein
MFFHLDGDAVFEQIIPFGEKFFRQRADALLGEFTVGRAPEIHLRVCDPMAAAGALSGGVVLEKFNQIPALRTFAFKYGAGLPVSAVLSWTFHGVVSFGIQFYCIKLFLNVKCQKRLKKALT